MLDSPVTNFLTSLSPSAIDGEIGSLGLDPSTEDRELTLVLEYLLAALETQKHFEFVQSIMNRVLKVHGSTIVQYKHMLELCQQLNQVQKRTWGRLEDAFQANIALVSHMAQIQL